jgi:phenylalanyl-tRNA synthetase alpha chain
MSLSLDKNEILKRISDTSSLDALEKFRLEYLGKKGLISLEMKSLSFLSIEEKKTKGQELNIFKSLLEKNIKEKKINIVN